MNLGKVRAEGHEGNDSAALPAMQTLRWMVAGPEAAGDAGADQCDDVRVASRRCGNSVGKNESTVHMPAEA